MKKLNQVINITINIVIIAAVLWAAFCVFYLCFPSDTKYLIAKVLASFAYEQQFISLMDGISYGSIATVLIAVFSRYFQLRAMTARSQTALTYNKAMSELSEAQNLNSKRETAIVERENIIIENIEIIKELQLINMDAQLPIINRTLRLATTPKDEKVTLEAAEQRLKALKERLGQSTVKPITTVVTELKQDIAPKKKLDANKIIDVGTDIANALLGSTGGQK